MATLEELSTLTSKGQTTVPRAVRRVLGLRAGDKIAFRVEGGRVTLVAKEAQERDPVLEQFLGFLERELTARPQVLQPVSREFATRIGRLVKGRKVDPDAAIDGDVAL